MTEAVVYDHMRARLNEAERHRALAPLRRRRRLDRLQRRADRARRRVEAVARATA